MAVWEVYLALLGVVVLGWLFGFGYRRLAEEAQWAAAKADLQSTAARAKSLEIAAKGAVTELEEVSGKLRALELEKARLRTEAARVPQLESATSELRQQLAHSQEALAAAGAREATAQGAVKAAEAELENMRSRAEASEVENARLRSEAERLPALGRTLSELRAELARTQQAQGAATSRASFAETGSKAAEAEQARLRLQLEASQAENGRLRSDVERLPVLEKTLSEVQAELARTHQVWLATEKRAEHLEQMQPSLELLRVELAALAEEKSRLESIATQVPGLQETATRREAQLDQLRAALGQAELENARLIARIDAGTSSADERQALLQETRTSLGEAFRALSAEALESSKQTFLDLARGAFDQLQRDLSRELDARERTIDGRLGPVLETVERLQGAVHDLETSRLESRAALSDDLETLRSSLHLETSPLAQTTGGPGPAPGAGAIPLRELVEMTGLTDHCSFEEQVGDPIEGGYLRPDAVIQLPGGRTIAIDSKVPLDAYLASLRVEEGPGRQELLRSHAAQMRRHVERLAAQSVGTSPSGDAFVIMYVPVEDGLAAALQTDPQLIHHAMGSSVIPAGPLALLTHLKTAAWTADAAFRHQRGA